MPAHLTIKGYIDKLMSIDEKYVVLWDELDERGWLVSGTSALLHLVRASLHHRSKSKFSAVFRWKQSNMIESESAVEVLINKSNRELGLFYVDKPTVSVENEQKREGVDGVNPSTAMKLKWDYYTFQDLVEQHYHYLDQIIDYQTRMEGRNGIDLKANFRTRLEGWDFVELATATQISPRVATLKAFKWGWVDFTRSVGAVSLFGCGFGELIKPEAFAGMCPKWRSLPKDKYYLAVSGMDLEKVKFDPGRLVWHSPAEPVAPCRCQSSGFRPTFVEHISQPTPLRELAAFCSATFGTVSLHDPVQVFYPRKPRHILPIRRPDKIHADGAYVFGHNVTWRYCWKPGKDGDEEDLEEEGLIYSACDGETSEIKIELDSQSLTETGRETVARSPQSYNSITDETASTSTPSGPSTRLSNTAIELLDTPNVF